MWQISHTNSDVVTVRKSGTAVSPSGENNNHTDGRGGGGYGEVH
jgi:hypothetical protein